MTKFLNAKWLAFYGGTIAFVVTLFTVATNYGESSLKAPPKIAGRYRIGTPNLPGCLSKKSLVLTIEQSGIYLNGSLSEAENSTQKRQFPLNGMWNQAQVELSGPLSQIRDCQVDSQAMVMIQGTLKESVLHGELGLSSVPGSVSFTAQREDMTKQTQNH